MKMTDAQRRTFEFRECLGSGGFGEVYLAKMTVPSGLSSTVAVKVLHAGLDPRSQGVMRLMDEGKILSMLNHPGIVGVHDLAIIDGRVALVTEFVEGADLTDVVVGEDPMPVGALFEAFASVADALHAAHEAVDVDGKPLGLLHRDVKPGNIRVGKHGQVKLLDFGIATATGMEREAQTGTNALIGSFAYMPPERFRRQALDPSSDFYSLGCALFECLTKQRLFHLDDMAALLGPKTDPETAKAFYDERFELLTGEATAAADLIRRMVAVRPAQRPSGPEIVAELEDLASEVGGVRLSRWARSHDWKREPIQQSGVLTGSIVVDTAEDSGMRTSDTMNLDEVPGTDVPMERERTPVLDDAPSLESTLSTPDAPTTRRGSPMLFVVPLLLFVLIGSLTVGAVAGLFVVFSRDDGAVTPPGPEPVATVEPQVEPEATDTPAPDATDVPEPQPAQPTTAPGPAQPSPIGTPTPRPKPSPVVSHAEVAEPVPTGPGIERCGQLAGLEQQAAAGTLSARACLSQAIRDQSLSQTDREKLGRILLRDAQLRCKNGDCADYEREQPYFLEEITYSDPEMSYAWARNRFERKKYADAHLWAERALERKKQWKGATYVTRVNATMGLRAESTYQMWSASPKNQRLRDLARTEAADWANYATQVGKPTQRAMDICVSAAGSTDRCNAQVHDSIAKETIVIASVPPGQRILIDGKNRGTTPTDIVLGYGEHVIVLEGTPGSERTIEVGTSKPKRWSWNPDTGGWKSAF